ncbi:MAG: hypothetical protein ACRD6U_05760 [Nitrososphaeraceae archaeon]|jgi:archaellum component FlaG (FlaF/FlaG flagellin family)
MIKRVLLSLAIASVITYFVYLGLMDSMTRSSPNYLSISNDTAVSIIFKNENISSDHLKTVNSEYVYIKGNGEIYESKKDTNFIGNYVRKNSPTITTGNHFGWEINLPALNQTYYVDHLTGEIISTN